MHRAGCGLGALPVLFWFLKKTGKVNDHLKQELDRRYYSWLVLIPLMIVPILIGAATTIVAIAILSLLCYREFARATGMFPRQADQCDGGARHPHLDLRGV